MDITDEKDELENIISTINALIKEINIGYYKSSLAELKDEAEKDLRDKNNILNEEFEKELKERNHEFWRDQF